MILAVPTNSMYMFFPVAVVAVSVRVRLTVSVQGCRAASEIVCKQPGKVAKRVIAVAFTTEGRNSPNVFGAEFSQGTKDGIPVYSKVTQVCHCFACFLIFLAIIKTIHAILC